MAKTKVKTRGLTDLNVTNAKIAAGTIDVTAKITGVVPAANLGTGTASSSTVLYGDGTFKSEPTYDDNTVQSNIAMLGFKVAINGSLARYNLVDQAIDEYEDASGVDASASTNEVRAGSAGAYYYSGKVVSANDADDTGTDGDYTWYKWTDTAATGSITPRVTLDVEYLMVGGGGSGGDENAGGGGAGGVITATGLELTGDAAYTVTVGGGGASVTGGSVGNVGGDSILSGAGISTLTGGGGGGGGKYNGDATAGRATNGNGGGGGYNGTAAGTGDGAGFDGGYQTNQGGPASAAAGGGGAAEVGEAGTSTKGGDGGDGVANDIIETGTDVYYAGGGGGYANNTQAACGAGGNGGGGIGDLNGGAGADKNGTANTGGGGGGSSDSSQTSGAGGSGIVILRGLTSELNSYNDLTLQSTDTTASTANPDYGELVCLIENSAGTATLNTDIKGYVSEDSGVTFTQGTFVDEGSWGTNKKIIAFHDLDISAQSGSSMCYKITTHNQAVDKITRVYATSLGWR
jgi:hypothetical protein